jgi:SAM-dependent methyltransferase
MTTYTLVPCLVCGAPGEELADADAVRTEVELLWAFHGRRLRPETPPRHLADRLAFSQRPPLRLARCAACGLVWRNPAEQSHEVEQLYAGEAPDPAVLSSLHAAQRASYDAQARRLGEALGRAGTVLEVGSYVGGFLAAARALGWRAEGVDVNAHANAFSRSLGLDVRDGEIDDVDAERRWDAVAIWNCLDQLARPREALAAAHARLAPGGMLALRVPNGGAYARLRARTSGPGPRATLARATLAHNNLLGFPYRWGFTPRALSTLLGALGFRVERVVGDVLVPVSDRWTRRWARMEERVAKAAMRAVARARPDHAPWFELYARRLG